MIVDPITRQRVLRMNNTGDINYDLDINAGSALAMETVPVIGPWEDNTGSSLEPSTKMQMYAGGAENQFQWTEPGLEGENLDRLNIVGQSASTTRRRLIKRNHGN